MALKKKTKSPGPVTIVAIGASAGGLKPLKEFFRSYKNFKKSAVVLIQHLSPTGKDLAIEVLSKLTKAPVKELVPGMKLLPGNVYFVPPQSYLAVSEGKVSPQKTKTRSQRLSVIDATFKALANAFTTKVIGIVLSGEGSDGAEGLRHIGAKGGVLMVQSLDSCEHSAMPQAAIATGEVDHILSPAEMPGEIAAYESYLEELLSKSTMADLHKDIGGALPEICELLLRVTRQDFKHYKTSTLIRRIFRRIQVLQLPTIEDYLELLRTSTEEVDGLFKELLINVTSFFRDPDAFAFFDAEVLKPALAMKGPEEKFRIWIAGCSTGEEAYTIAMLTCERLRELEQPPEVQIIATDIDEQALNIARKGVYAQSIERSVPAEFLSRYFTKRGGKYHVTKELRDLCLFSSHNLINDPPFSHIDIITCRNVLIYLGAHLQKKIIPVFHYSLKPNGYLFLGNSESLSTHKELFRLVSSRHRIAQRKSTAVRPPTTFSTSIHSSTYAHQLKEEFRNEGHDLHLICQRIILDEFSPKYLVANDDGNIISTSTGISEYLEPSEGAFLNNIFKLVRPELRMALRTTFAEAKKHKRKMDHESASIKVASGHHRLGLTVQPMPKLGEESQLYLVVFRPLEHLDGERPVQSGVSTEANLNLIDHLERELAATRDDLDRTVQDLEASNEELKSSNEELLSMNEELQSANEELETSKEEVQSTNDALLRSYSDLENLLASTDIATLFLTADLRINNFTPASTAIYRITRGDIGREISDFTHSASKMPPYPSLEEVKRLKAPMVQEVSLEGGRVFQRRIVPYRTHESEIDGLVVTFVDVTELKLTNRQLVESQERYQFASRATFNMIWDWNLVTNDVRWNDAIHSLLGHPKSVMNSTADWWIENVHPDDRADVVDSIHHVIDSRQETHWSHEYRYRRGDGSYVEVFDRGFVIRDSSGKSVRMIGAMEDRTELKKNQQTLLERERQYRTIFEASHDAIMIFDQSGRLIETNPASCKMHGYAHNEMIGMNGLDFVHPEDLHEFARFIEDVNSGKRFRVVARHVRRNGETIHVEVTGSGITFDGSPALLAVVRDITDRKKAEDALRYQSNLTKTITDNAASCLFMMDKKGHPTFMNPAAMRVTGYDSIDEIKDRPLHYAVHWKKPDGSHYPMEECPIDNAQAELKHAKDQEEIFCRKDGTLFPVTYSVMPLEKDGEVVGSVLEFRDTTQEKSLARELMQLAAVAENTGDFVGIADVGMKPFYVNKAGRRMVGLEEKEVSGTQVLEYFPQEDRKFVEENVIPAVLTSGYWQGELRFRNFKTGESFPVLYNLFPILDDLGEIIAFATVTREISELKRAQAQVEEKEARLRTYIESMPQMTFLADAQGNMVYFNDRHYEYFGLSREDQLEWKWTDQPMHHPEDLSKTIERWSHSVKTGDPYEIEYRLRRHDGSYRWHLGRALPIRDSQGQITEWFGTNTDIHDQKTAAEEVNRIIEGMNDGFFTVDRNWIITRVNANAAKTAHLSREELLGKDFLETFFSTPETEQSSYVKNYKSAMNEGKFVSFEDYYSPLDVWTSVDVYPVNEGRDGLAVFFRDVSLEKRALRDLQQAIAARDEFMSIASHELKTPLTSMIIQAQLQKRMIANDDHRAFSKDRVVKLIEQFDRLFGRLNRLVDDMLDVSRIQTGKLNLKLEMTDLCSIISDVVIRQSGEFIAAGAGTPEFQGKSVELNIDPMRIEQVVSNLLTNALRYGEKKPVVVRLTDLGSRVRVEVSDQGRGIAPEDQEKIFRRFERAVDATEISGLGLGLFISTQIISAHNGEMGVESTPGKGSTFWFELPR